MAEEGQKSLVRIRGQAAGLAVEVEVYCYPRDIVRAAERLAELGLEPPTAAAPSAPSKPQARPDELMQSPAYDADGELCCPVHHKRLKPGKFGLYCPAKAEPPIGNDKGYCRYSYRDE